ncbi:VIP peptides-like isoform X3 [Coregonus clupeaformis]|uniref:VIP peptides-like isoform X3 n=1 Tax=Coregonus clupeaformis TaxID=59861 RepID=UPI001E1C6F67|nr:VIP peptides-like isoform X3 [Coregonus clupeaformis]
MQSVMAQTNCFHRLFLMALCSMLCTRTMSLPAVAAYSVRSGTVETDGKGDWEQSLSINDMETLKLLYDIIASNDLMEDQLPVKRHSDAVFTDNYSRYGKQMAIKKYLNSALSRKRSLEDPTIPELSIRSEPSSQQTNDDISIHELLNSLSLTL